MTELAESLTERGIQVTALAGRGLYNGGERLARSEEHRGVRIERAWSTSFGKRTTLARVSDYLSFYVGAFWKMLRLPRHELVMALTTPPLIGWSLVVGGFEDASRLSLRRLPGHSDCSPVRWRLASSDPVDRLYQRPDAKTIGSQCRLSHVCATGLSRSANNARRESTSSTTGRTDPTSGRSGRRAQSFCRRAKLGDIVCRSFPAISAGQRVLAVLERRGFCASEKTSLSVCRRWREGGESRSPPSSTT